MLLAEDQHSIGDLGPGGEHEPFRASVRARERACAVLSGLPRCSNCTGRSGPPGKSAARSPRSSRRLRICCTVQGPSGLAVIPRMCT